MLIVLPPWFSLSLRRAKPLCCTKVRDWDLLSEEFWCILIHLSLLQGDEADLEDVAQPTQADVDQ
jgi:hypothetical protein